MYCLRVYTDVVVLVCFGDDGDDNDMLWDAACIHSLLVHLLVVRQAQGVCGCGVVLCTADQIQAEPMMVNTK